MIKKSGLTVLNTEMNEMKHESVLKVALSSLAF